MFATRRHDGRVCRRPTRSSGPFFTSRRETAYGQRASRDARSHLDDHTRDSDITVVCNSGGVTQLDASVPTAAVREVTDAEVRVCACQNSLRGDADQPELRAGVEIVLTAVGELTRRQVAGDASP